MRDYFAEFGEWLGPFKQPFAIVMLDLAAKCQSGTQLARFNWHRGTIKQVRLVVEEIDIKPQGIVDSEAGHTV